MKKNSYFILLFTFSALVMFIEIIGAKLLTPLVGGSHLSWISQILITLLSLSLGAYLSSYLKSIKQLSYAVFISSIIFSSVIFSYSSIGDFSENWSLVTRSLFLSVIFYGIPLSALGMTFPFITKILHSNYNLSLGLISSISTLGSVFGVIASFFAVLLGSNFILLLSSSLILSIISIMTLRINKESSKYPELTMFLLIVMAAITSSKQNHSNQEIVFFTNSHFGELTLVKEHNTTKLINDNLEQNAYNEKNESINLFTYALRVLPMSARKINNALILGLGLGFVAKDLESMGVKTEAVEINHEMIKLSKKILNLDIPIHEADARVFIKNTKKTYDLIVHDVFLIDNVPKHLLTQETMLDIKKRLNRGGILSMNTFGITNPSDYLTNATFYTLKSVFKYVKSYSINEYNVFFLASDEPIVINNISMENIPVFMHQKLISLFLNEVKNFQKVDILKDSLNLVDFYDNSPRELYRKRHSVKINQ